MHLYRVIQSARRYPLRSVCAAGLALAAIHLAPHTPALGDGKPSPIDVTTGPIEVHAQPLAGFDRLTPDNTRFGKLVWRGGLVLTSPSPHFGGWSGLVIDANGKEFLSISDAGTWMSGRLDYDKDRPAGMSGVRLGPLQAPSGETFAGKSTRDAEGLALTAGTPVDGSALVSFERKHRILKFDVKGGVLSAATGTVPLPAAAQSLPGNSGIEAITVLRGGPRKDELVAFAESEHDARGNHIGWLWVDGTPQEFYLSNPRDFDVTDAAGLADGSLLVLERRFRWSEGVKMRLRLIRRDELQPKAVIDAEVLIEADPNREIDNMEGLAVHTGSGGETVVTMISDDNFNKGLQRTLLLQFTLDVADLASSREHPAR
jgi:hypothetical protein